MAHYTVKAWSNEGPLRLSEPMTAQRALRKATELRERGFTHITISNVESGVEIELDHFIREQPDT